MGIMTALCEHGAPSTPEEYKDLLIPYHILSVILGVVLVVGGVISTIPQHIKIFQTKETIGIAPIYLFLSNVNQIGTLFNGILLKAPQIEACRVLGFTQCYPSLLSLFQMIGFWVASFPFFIYFLVLTPRSISHSRRHEWVLASALFVLFLVTAMALGLVSGFLLRAYGECGGPVLNFGFGLGILGTVITCIQWAPQIYKTFVAKSSGSFSILSLCIQAPGTFLICYYMIFQSHEEVSTWISYFAAACQQVILIIMLIYYDQKNKRRQHEYSVNQDLVEQERLLANVIE